MMCKTRSAVRMFLGVIFHFLGRDLFLRTIEILLGRDGSHLPAKIAH